MKELESLRGGAATGAGQGLPSAGGGRKRWAAPRIVQHDVLETVAALCVGNNEKEIPKTTIACNVIQT